MPPLPGEERLVTLFTDCHYYFAQPTARPILHRFNKSSYFYVYYNSTRQTSRIEVANSPGTSDQEAFYGYLDTCRIVNSYKFPTLVTLIVDAVDDKATPPAPKNNNDPEEWRLSTGDPRDPNQTKYRLHTIDFYFWTQEDARLITDFFRKLLHPAQLDLPEPSQSQSQSQSQLQPPQQQQQQQQQRSRQSADNAISPVVQNLENVAISDPAYRNGQTRNSQNQPQAVPMTIPLPPPPPPPPSQAPVNQRATATQSVASSSPVSQLSHTDRGKSPRSDNPVNYTPIPYNPASPAAPEKIVHREKTPPPEDNIPGTGLGAAVHDQTTVSGYAPSQSWGAPPTSSHISQPGQWGSPPPPSGVHGYGSPPQSVGYGSPPPPTQQYQPARTSGTSVLTTPSFAPPPSSTTTNRDSHRHSTAAEIYTPETSTFDPPPVETPGAQFYNTIQQPPKPLQHVQPQYADYLAGGTKPGAQPPPGGWADYSYAQGGQGQGHSGHSHHHGSHGSTTGYDVHNQVYRPTEAEAHSHSKKKSSRVDSSLSQPLSNTKVGSKAKGFFKRALEM